MYHSTATFYDAVIRSHRMVVLIEVLQNGIVIGDPIVTAVDGAVTFDARAQIRSRLDLTLVDDGTLDLVPRDATGLLAPYGNELRVSRGVRFPDGSVELVPLGVFRLNDTDIDDAGLTIKISAPDRAARIIDAKFEEPGQIAQGTNVADAILELIAPAYPDVVTDFATTAQTTPAIFWEEQGDRWQVAQDLATASALRLFFDRDGKLALRQSTVHTTYVVLAEGEGGLLLSVGRRWTRQGAHNRWIVTGENTGEGAPVRAVALDDDSLSPTYYYGPFGKAPAPTYVSQFVTTADQAQDVANALKDRGRGITQSITFGTIVLPQIDPDDEVTITRERVGISAERHVIDQLVIPLTADGVMTGATRAVQVIT